MPSPAPQSAPAASDLALTVTRIFDAPREAVFAAWADPTQMSRWLGHETVTGEVTELEPRVGGSYRFVMHGIPGGGHYAVRGTYREFDPPSRLVLTWAWEADAQTRRLGHETLVTVTFRALGDRTELTVRHERFDTSEARDSHHRGWTGALDKMAKLFTPGRA